MAFDKRDYKDLVKEERLGDVTVILPGKNNFGSSEVRNHADRGDQEKNDKRTRYNYEDIMADIRDFTSSNSLELFDSLKIEDLIKFLKRY